MRSTAPRARSTLAVLLGLTGLAGSAGLASATEGSPIVVEIEADRFVPDRVEIEAGATIEWHNAADVARSVEADDGSFDSGRLRPGQSVVVSFAEPGEYPYHGTVGGRNPSSPAGLVVVHPSDPGGQGTPPPEDPAEQPSEGVDAEEPADEEAPPPADATPPPPVEDALWDPGPDDPATQPGEVTAPPAPAAVPASAGRSAVVAGQAQEGVTIVDNAYQPKQIEVDAGTTVLWTQEGELPHTVTADDGSFDSGEMGQGDTYSQTFQQPGSFPYYCTFHGAPGGVGMSGTVVVSGGAGGPGDGQDPSGDEGQGNAADDQPEATLADTGTSVGPLSLAAVALMVAGITLLLVDRGRRPAVPALTGFENLGPPDPAPQGRPLLG
jgi:plastocyanin